MKVLTEFPASSASDNGPFHSRTVSARDGTGLVAYVSAGPIGAPNLLLVNALGFPARFLEPLASQAVNCATVITWDQRAMPGPGVSDGRGIVPGTQCNDLLDVLAAMGFDDLYAIAFCNGAEIALMAAIELGPRKLRKLVTTNGHFSLSGVPNTANTTGLLNLLCSLRSSPERLDAYYKVLNSASKKTLPVPEDVLKYPFRFGADKLLRLANMLERLEQNAMDDWIGKVAVPVEVFIAEADDVSHSAHSEALCVRLPKAKMTRVADANHYSIYNDALYQSRLITAALNGGS